MLETSRIVTIATREAQPLYIMCGRFWEEYSHVPLVFRLDWITIQTRDRGDVKLKSGPKPYSSWSRVVASQEANRCSRGALWFTEKTCPGSWLGIYLLSIDPRGETILYEVDAGDIGLNAVKFTIDVELIMRQSVLFEPKQLERFGGGDIGVGRLW